MVLARASPGELGVGGRQAIEEDRRETRVRIGPAGWFYEDWRGKVYPAARPPGFDELVFLADFIDTIEINNTFYRPATKDMAQGWAKRVSVNRKFKFTAKLGRDFTHTAQPVSSEEEKLFKGGLDPLLEIGLLGCLLIQFPWSFKCTSENRLKLLDIFQRFQEYPKVLEVRHASWNNPAVFDFLLEHNVGFVNIDQPLIGRSLAPTEEAVGPIGYVRLHGRNYQEWFKADAGRDERYNYLYSAEELLPWAERTGRIAAKSEETYVITNNHYRGQAVVNALQLKSMLTGSRVKVPEPLLSSYPFLQKIAQPVAGQLLLVSESLANEVTK